MFVIGMLTLVCSFTLCVCSTLFVRRLAPRVRLIDEPDQRKRHERLVPLGGGIAIWASVVLTVAGAYAAAWLVTADWSGLSRIVPQEVTRHIPGMFHQLPTVCVVLGAASIMMAVGLCDDIFKLGYFPRLVAQIVLASAIVAWGIRVTLFPPFSNYWVSVLVTVLWIVGLTNAFNFLDNMDGLSAGVAAISVALFAVLMSFMGDYFVAGFLLCLLGALLGFLLFNWPPASIFMGDAGSYFVGFLIGVITVLSTFTRPGLPEIAIAAPLCVLAVPLYDSATVIAIRLSRGRSPFEADRNHFSHRLVRLGMNERQAVLTIYLVTVATGLGALSLYPLSASYPGLAALVTVSQVASLLGVIAILEVAARRGEKNRQEEKTTEK